MHVGCGLVLSQDEQGARVVRRGCVCVVRVWRGNLCVALCTGSEWRFGVDGLAWDTRCLCAGEGGREGTGRKGGV